MAGILNSSSGRCWSSDTYNPVPGVLPSVPSSNDYKVGSLHNCRVTTQLSGHHATLGSLHNCSVTALLSGRCTTLGSLHNCRVTAQLSGYHTTLGSPHNSRVTTQLSGHQTKNDNNKSKLLITINC